MQRNCHPFAGLFGFAAGRLKLKRMTHLQRNPCPFAALQIETCREETLVSTRLFPICLALERSQEHQKRIRIDQDTVKTMKVCHPETLIPSQLFTNETLLQ